MKINAIVEIPKNSDVKYEYNLKTKMFEVDRILYGSNRYPQNYGFINNTLDWDGDPLDILIIANHEFQPGTIVPTRILGAMKMIDGGETDTKLIGVIDVDPRFDHIKTLDDVNENVLNEISDFFENYKNLQKKTVEINGFEDLKYAIKELEETRELFNKYKDFSKEEFIKKMKTSHPEKYK